MADAQLMEEQLQHSALLSEQGSGHGDADVDADMDVSMGNDGAFVTNHQIDVGSAMDEGDEDDEMVDGEDEEDASGSEEGSESEEDDDDAYGDEDAEGEDDDEVPALPSSQRRRRGTEEDDDDEGDEEEEAEEPEDDDEDEGVGAVKIKPGETDDDDSSSDSGTSGSDGESEGELEWDDTKAEGVDDEDESEPGDSNTCLFCKHEEDPNPGEDSEKPLTCSSCGDTAHQQCARSNGAFTGKEVAAWKCPECADSDESDAAAELDGEEESGVNGDTNDSVSRRATAQKLARDLLPSQKGAVKPDSHSVFNQLVLDDDPMDGSRVLRKRKASSIEADESVMALRRRRRDTDEQSIDESNSQEGTTRPQSARSLRNKTPGQLASIVKSTRQSIIVKIRVNSSDLRQILSRKPRRDKKRSNRGGTQSRRNGTSREPAAPALPVATPFTSTAYSQPFYSFYDKETDELKGKPYGGILTEAEADTSKTMPTNDDRRRFDEAKQKAEEEWRQRLLKMQSEVEVPAKKSKKASGPASQIECIEFGGWEIDTWYAAPYPEEYSRNRVLYICEFCLKYMNSDYVAWRHKLKCPAKHPPGDEIYRHSSVSVFEVDGRKNPVYCQNLCLLAKLFLGSKTLYYDVEPFLFYVLCEYDDLGYHFVGYFSKEKRASSQNNVSCILTLPIHQRKGYGNLLIDFSYLLTRVEKKTGSPEKPLSDMGLVSYRNYWRLIMCRYLLEHSSADRPEKKGLSIKKISDDTGLTPDDVISALEGLRCLVRDPQTQLYAFRVDQAYCREYIAKWESKGYVQLNPSALTWTPYVMGRSNATNFELGPALNAIAPREDEEEQKGVAPVALVNGTGPAEPPAAVEEESKMEVDNTVLESTELNETGDMLNGNTADKPNGILPNGEHSEDKVGDETGETEDAVATDWTTQYNNIPPARFEVVPPITGSRRNDRSRPVVPRPPVVRPPNTVPRPRPKRPSGSSRRSSAAKPKSSSKRKTGGTGRGPGRWPKGTKKSDYGNADSGPGFPPGWQKPASLTPDAKKKSTDAHDTVEVQTPTLKESTSSLLGKENGGVDGDAIMAGAEGDE
ncbi:hypothetical protein OQA88_10207 [Cercophora sp. LCS_1]